MNAPVRGPSFPWGGLCCVFLLCAVLSPVWLVGTALLGVMSCFRVGGEAAALRDSLVPGAAETWPTEVEFTLGWVPLTLAQAGLAFAPVPPQARLAVRAIERAEVAVYQRETNGSKGSRSALLAAADQAMEARGWIRVVGVVEGEQLVVVYAPKSVSSTRHLKFCLAVLEPRQLVVVSAQGNVEPLLELVQTQTKSQAAGHFLSALH